MFYVYNITSHYFIFLFKVPPRKWSKKAETCRRTTKCLCIIVSNYSTVVGIYTVVCFTAHNVQSFRLFSPFLSHQHTYLR
jgi:hypothetical protein